MTALQLVELYRTRDLSPVEVGVCLERVERLDGVLNAFCLVDSERALGEAKASEARWRRGEPCGLIDGVPVAVKDVFLTAGWPTLRGSRAVDPAGPWNADAPAVAALRRHGGVIVGKTTTPEFGWKGVTDSPLTGVTRNPWNPERTSGGSSGGSAAALAAGMVALALGTDAGGSIRIPCSFCGLPGLKPTYGRVPFWPASPFGVLAHAGPMARTVIDVALMLDVIATPDPRDWAALPPPTDKYTDNLDPDLTGLRIAYSPDLGYVDVDPQIAQLTQHAATTLTQLGAHIQTANPDFENPREAFDMVWTTAAAAAVQGVNGSHTSEFDPGLVDAAAAGRSHTALDYLETVQQRDALGLRMSSFHRDWDLLVTPTLPIAAFAAGREVPEGWPGRGWPSWTPFTYPFNLTQQPAASVPCGFTTDDRPVGLQIVGPRYGDALVLRAARAYEAASPQPTITEAATKRDP